jgi:hypothetical protein
VSAPRLVRALALLVLALGIACAAGPSGLDVAAQRGAGRRILFVGNSLTYVNDLPLVVRALSQAAGEDSAFRVGMVAQPDFSLEDHWANGAAARELATGKWDVVVLQQGPSSLESSRALLVDYARRFATLARGANAQPTLYAPWPTADRAQDFARSAESYRIAADSAHALIFPVGEAWLAAWKRSPQLGLYAADGLHPSVYGTYLAALVIHGRLTGRSPIGLPASLVLETGQRIDVPASVASVLQAAAAEVNAKP